MSFDYYFGPIEEIEFEFDAFDYLGNSPDPGDSDCLEHFFKNIHSIRIGRDQHDFVSGHLWNIYSCNHVIEVLKVRPDKIVVTKVYPGGPSKGAHRIVI